MKYGPLRLANVNRKSAMYVLPMKSYISVHTTVNNIHKPHD